MAVRQTSLFPDGAQVRDRVVAALEELDVVEGRARLAEARSCAPELAGLDALAQGLDWLERQLGGARPDIELAARTWLALSSTRFHRGLAQAAADLVDEALARYLLVRGPRGEPFVDAEQRVPRGALHLVLDQPRIAFEELRALGPSDRRRADLSSWLADACLRSDRAELASPNYARALLFSPDGVDFGRMAQRDLVDRLAALEAEMSPPLARAALFAHAWIDGLFDVTPENEWLDEGQVASLLASTGSASAVDRARRFALLLYRDRSRPLGSWDESERAEMEALDAKLYAGYRATRDRPGRTRTGPLRW